MFSESLFFDVSFFFDKTLGMHVCKIRCAHMPRFTFKGELLKAIDEKFTAYKDIANFQDLRVERTPVALSVDAPTPFVPILASNQREHAKVKKLWARVSRDVSTSLTAKAGVVMFPNFSIWRPNPDEIEYKKLNLSAVPTGSLIKPSTEPRLVPFYISGSQYQKAIPIGAEFQTIAPFQRLGTGGSVMTKENVAQLIKKEW